MALPGTGKNFDQFRYDDATCRQFAKEQIDGATSSQDSNDKFAKRAVIGTAIGSAIGAAVDVDGDKIKSGETTTGLFIGSLIGADENITSSYRMQRHYDNAYVQCMYAKGHRVPVSGHIEQQPLYGQAPKANQDSPRG